MKALALPPASYRPLTISSGLRAAATRNPDKPAMILGEERRSYRKVIANINQIANMALQELGLRSGDTAAIISPNTMEYLEIVAGLSDIGAAVVTPNFKLPASEVADICNDAKVRILFVHADCEDRIDLKRLETVERVVRLGRDYETLKAGASDRFDPPHIPDWTTFSIPYTSGTTGKPKGVMLSHRCRSLGFLAYAAEYGIYSPDDHFLAIAPMCHGAGFAFAFAALFLGGTVEIMPKFDPELFLRTLHKGDVTGFFAVPTHFHGIFDLEKRLLSSLKGNRLKGIVSNAAPLSQDAKGHIVEYFGTGLLNETYGSTEAAVVTNLRPADQQRKIKCVGQPFVGNQVCLLDEAGREVATGDVGELFSTSPYLFNGYWGKPAETGETFRDGWVSVGDLARRDEEGFLYIVDRKKDMIISGGMNIYPREVETVLDRSDGVRETAIIGVPDARWGEQLVAYYVPSDAGMSQIGTPDLAAFCAQHLAPHKRPKAFVEIAALPRNANGKVLKTELRKLHAAHKEKTP